MSEIWCGDEESFQVTITAQACVAKMAASSGGMMPDLPPTWEKQGSLGVVPVSGSLIQGHAGWMSMFGVNGYDDIASGLVAAATDPEVKSILLHVNSPGGSVHGVQPLADLISKIATVKPVSAHIGRVGASAGYWLASAAPHVSIDPMGITGSIGAMQVHRTTHRMATENGVDNTIVRSGENKALGNPIEPLSEAGKAEMQSQVDDVGGLFQDHVAKKRNMNPSDMGKGSTFLGKRAVQAGLADKVATYDQAVAAATKKR